MATASDIVTRSMRSLRLLASGDEPTADELADALVALNDMLFGWRIEGLDIAHTTLVAATTVDVPDDHLNTIRLSLAERLSGEFGAELSPSDQMTLSEGMKALRAYYLSIADLTGDNPLAYHNMARTG